MKLQKKYRLKRLLKILNSEVTPEQYTDAILALGRLGDPEAFEILAEKLQDGYAEAATALGHLGDKRAISILKDHLCTDQGELRLNCAKALGSLGETTWQSHILGDEEDFERMAATDDDRAISLLMEAACSHREENNPAITALAQSNNPVAANAARERLDNSGGTRKGRLIRILGDLKDLQSVPQLIDNLKDSDNGNNIVVIKALGKIGDARAIEPLIGVTSDELLQDAAINALTLID